MTFRYPVKKGIVFLTNGTDKIVYDLIATGTGYRAYADEKHKTPIIIKPTEMHAWEPLL